MSENAQERSSRRRNATSGLPRTRQRRGQPGPKSFRERDLFRSEHRRRNYLPTAELVSAHLKPAHVARLAPSLHEGEEGVRPGPVEAVEQALALPGAAFTIVVARGASLS